LILQSRIHTELGAFEEALLDIDNALVHCPKNARLYAERALVRLQLSEDREAMDDCESAIFLLGKDPSVLVLCHQVFSQLDEYEAANDAYTQMIDRNLDMPLLFLLRGRVRIAINMTRAAKGDFRRFSRLTGNALVERELVAEELLRAETS
jgi:tetratricopeptide (TPR) repeat protein